MTSRDKNLVNMESFLQFQMSDIKPKVIIATPLYNEMNHSRLTESIADMTMYGLMRKRYLAKWLCAGADFYTTDIGRAYLAQLALQNSIEYIMWIDGDNIGPYDGIERLMNMNVDAAGANYWRRRGGSYRISMIFDENASGYTPREYPKKLPTGIIECDATAHGFLLMKTELFKDMPKPWFKTVLGEFNVEMTADIWMFNQIRKVRPNFKVHINCDIVVEHIGMGSVTSGEMRML